jgi:hypothetical protein
MLVQEFCVLVDFRKILEASNGDFKPQQRDRAKYTVETNGTLDVGEGMCGDES